MADVVDVRLPTRYEDLDPAFRGRLRPVPELVALVQDAYRSARMSGGLRFLPMFGRSGSGKSCAALELATHLPDCHVFELARDDMQSREALEAALLARRDRIEGQLIVGVVDQYEEAVSDTALPKRVVEWLSLLDRGSLRTVPTLIIWLTTSRDFQAELATATSRNERILVAPDFELVGPEPEGWPSIIEETFEFHNGNTPLADYEVLQTDLNQIGKEEDTLGDAIEAVGTRLSNGTSPLQDMSRFQVLMLWPVTDGTRISRISNFTQPREGYKLDWGAWFRELSEEDRKQLPLEAYNRARLYFDIRLIPIAAADLKPLCRDLDDDDDPLHGSYVDQFCNSHFYSILTNTWDPANFTPLRERESQRATDARDWYESVTTRPTALGKRIARVLRTRGIDAHYERTVRSRFSQVRADVLVNRDSGQKPVAIVEIKAFGPKNTMPSTIRDAVKVTMRRHAQLVGFLARS